MLNVPFLAAGELMLLFDRAWVRWACWLVLVFLTAYTMAVVAGADASSVALAERLPVGQGRLRRRHARAPAARS